MIINQKTIDTPYSHGQSPYLTFLFLDKEKFGTYTVFGPTTLFAGHFNGGGHTIYNMRIEVPEEDSKSSNKKLFFGLFGMARYGSIKNITLASDCNVDINNYTLYGDTNYARATSLAAYWVEHTDTRNMKATIQT